MSLPLPFSTLSHDAWGYLLSFLKPKDFWNLSHSCQLFSRFFDDQFWKRSFLEWMHQNSLSQIDQSLMDTNFKAHVFPKPSKNIWRQRSSLFFTPSKTGYSLIKRKGKKKIQPFLTYPMWVLGDVGVGKSSLVIQWAQHHFVEHYDAEIEDSYRKSVMVDELPALADILDTYLLTVDNPLWNKYREQHIDSAFASVIVYAIDNRDSFRNIHIYLERVSKMKFRGSPVFLVGTKCDLKEARQVEFGEGLVLATMIGATFFEVSSKTGLRTEKLFHQIIRDMRLWCQSAPTLPQPVSEAKWLEEFGSEKKKKTRPDCSLQ